MISTVFVLLILAGIRILSVNASQEGFVDLAEVESSSEEETDIYAVCKFYDAYPHIRDNF